MPFYDYYCEKNKKTVEVYHKISVRLKTWGEVCQHAQISLGKTSPAAPVIRLIQNVTPTIFRVKGLDKDEPSTKLNL